MFCSLHSNNCAKIKKVPKFFNKLNFCPKNPFLRSWCRRKKREEKFCWVVKFRFFLKAFIWTKFKKSWPVS